MAKPENKLMKRCVCLLACSSMGLVLMVRQCLAQLVYTPYMFTTLAGNTGYGSVDGTGIAARFWWPSAVAVDGEGNVYVADTENSTIRKVTPTGVVTTLAGLAGTVGSTDGIGSAARFNQPYGVAVDNARNVYVGDTLNNTIRKVTAEGLVTTLAGLAGSQGNLDGIGSAARFAFPSGVAVDGAGIVYVGDTHNGSIRKVTPAGGVTTLATGFNFMAPYGYPSGGGVAVDTAGNVYVADQGNQTIRKVTPDGVVTTLAGVTLSSGDQNGTGSAVRFSWPAGVAVDSAGNVYVGDTENNAIRKVTPAGAVTTLAAGFRFWTPYGSPSGGGVAVDRAGNVFVADTMNNTIRKVTPGGGVTALAGLGGSSGSSNGTGSAARFNFSGTPGVLPGGGVAVDSAGNLFVADTDNGTIRKVTPVGAVTTLAGLAGSYGAVDGVRSTARFYAPCGVAVDSTGNVFVADTWNNTIRKVTPVGVVTTLAGLARSSGFADGTNSTARFWWPNDLAVDSTGNIYVADTENCAIRKVTSAGVVTTIAGGSYGSMDGVGSTSQFNRPHGVAVDGAGDVYVADTWNSTIRKVTPDGVVTTLAGLARSLFDNADGTGSAARFWIPSDVAVDSAGNVYVADSGNYSIRKMTPTGVVTTLAGGSYGSVDGTGRAAQFAFPSGVAVDSRGNVYVADTFNNIIRRGSLTFMILNSRPAFGFSGSQFSFGLPGPVGQSIVVEASTDLVSWLPLWTNTFTGTLDFSDPQSGVYCQRPPAKPEA